MTDEDARPFAGLAVNLKGPAKDSNGRITLSFWV